MNKYNITYQLSRLLEKCGILTYIERVEFAAHLGWSLVISLIGLMIGNIYGSILISLWILFCISDEFIFDGFKGTDTYWDLGSKLLIPILTGAYLWLR